jgi:hypothetical protein
MVLRARVVRYAPRAFKVFMETGVVYTSEGAHWIGNRMLKSHF